MEKTIQRKLAIDTSFKDIDREGLGDYLDGWNLDETMLHDLLLDGYTYNMDDKLVTLDHKTMLALMYNHYIE